MKTILFTILLPIIILTSSSLYAEDERHIHLNAQHLTPDSIIKLDKKNGATVPDGNYWLNSKTGQWGFEGSLDVKGTINTTMAQNNIPQGLGIVNNENIIEQGYERVVANSLSN